MVIGKKLGNLYNDINKKNTIHGTGYKNETAVIKTINLIKNRSIKYQKSVMITMYYRAKHHKYITKEMIKAMHLIKKWLIKYKNAMRKYPYLKLDLINKYEKLAYIYNMPQTMMGFQKSPKNKKGFLEIYKKINGAYGKLAFILTIPSKPNGLDYDIFRQLYIDSKLKKLKKFPLYYHGGKYKNLPTKQHLMLIMNGYSPDTHNIQSKAKLLLDL